MFPDSAIQLEQLLPRVKEEKNNHVVILGFIEQYCVSSHLLRFTIDVFLFSKPCASGSTGQFATVR